MKKNFNFIIITIMFISISIITIIFIAINDIYNHENYKVHYYRINNLYSIMELKSESFEEKMFKSISSEKDKLIRAEYYDALTRYYILNNNLDKAKVYLDKSMDEYSEIRNGNNYNLNAFKNASILDIWQINSNKSISYCNLMLETVQNKKVIENSNFTKDDIEGLSYAMLSIFYGKSNNFDKANDCYNFLNNMDYKNIHDLEIKYLISYAKSMYNVRWGDIKKAEKDLNFLSEQIDKETMSLMYIRPRIYLTTSVVEIMNGNLENVPINIDKTIRLNRNIRNKVLIESYIAYGFYYDKLNNFEKAKENYDIALSISEEINNNVESIRSLGSLIQLYEKNNKIIDKESYYKKFWNLSNVKENGKLMHVNNIINLNNQLNNESFSIIENKRKLEIGKRRITDLALGITIITLIFLSFIIHRLYNEIKLRKETELELKKIINHDYLTKAYSKGYAYNKLKKSIESKESIYIAMVDFDNYKKINDRFGHNIGDIVLITFVQICKKFLVEEDFIARFGGEEFIIILKNKTQEEAFKVIENIRKALEENTWEIEGLKSTISVGLIKNNYNDVNMIIKKADELLYLAKKTGKNKVQM